MSAREEILARVRAATARVTTPAGGVATAETPRTYRAHVEPSVDQFIARLQHYDARTRRVAPGELDAAVLDALAARGARRVVAPRGIPETWLAGVEPLRDDPPLGPHDLDRSEGVVSTCAVAIAETGTLVLDGGPGMGRRMLSLVPDYHLCVVRAEQIVGSVPEAIAKLDPTRPLTFISGPSATVDIELVRIKGVHGPRTLEVIVVDAGAIW